MFNEWLKGNDPIDERKLCERCGREIEDGQIYRDEGEEICRNCYNDSGQNEQ